MAFSIQVKNGWSKSFNSTSRNIYSRYIAWIESRQQYISSLLRSKQNLWWFNNILCDKLGNCSITNRASDWIKGYLKDRSQYGTVCNIKCNQVNGEQVKCGTPHGSVPGSLYFMPFMNDIINNLKGKMYSLMDNTVIYISGKDTTRIWIRIWN